MDRNPRTRSRKGPTKREIFARKLVAGDPMHAIFVCVEHIDPKRPDYRHAVDKVAAHVAAKIQAQESARMLKNLS